MKMKKGLIILILMCLLTLYVTGCKETEKEAEKEVVIQEVNEDENTVVDQETEEEIIEEVPEVVVKNIETVVSQRNQVSLSDADYTTYNTSTHVKKREPIKGIYVSAYTAGISTSRANLLTLADETEVNSFVIDVKADTGRIMFEMDHPIIDEIGAEYLAMADIEKIMDELYAHNIYPIARIVAFKDPYLASKKTDYAIKNQDGSLFYYSKVAWLNPYNEDTWTYIVDVAKEAAKVGFKEIQFDYIRFEATNKLNNADFGDIDPSLTREDIIVSFLEYAEAELKPYDVEISADVFGTIITSEVDAKAIGQDYHRMSEYLDVICPMIYPSHYAKGSYGVPYDSHPDLHPYTIIYGSMMDSNEVLADLIAEDKIVVRPWLQAFTASYLKAPNYMVYDGAEMRVQMQAAYDAGLEEWILWDPANTYPYSAFLGPEE